MNFESTLSNDEIIRSPDTSYVPDDTGDSGSDSISGDNVPAAPPISSIDVNDGKTTVVIVQQPAADTGEDRTDNTTADGVEEQPAADVQLTTTVDEQVEDVTGLPGVVKSVFGEYRPRTQTITETRADGTVLTSVECVPGLAGLDWYWLSGVFMFGLILWSFFRFLGGVLKS